MYNVYCDICGYLKGSFKKVELNCPICNNGLKYTEQLETNQIKKIVKMTREEKNLYIENMSGHPIDSSYKNKLLDYEIENHNRNQQRLNKAPKVACPYCQSTNTKKISGTTRFVSTEILGLASGKLGKQWHCNSCKSDF